MKWILLPLRLLVVVFVYPILAACILGQSMGWHENPTVEFEKQHKSLRDFILWNKGA